MAMAIMITSDRSNYLKQAISTPDAKKTINNIEEGDLIIRDLGYVSIDILKAIQEIGANFLNRINYNTNVYEKKNGKFYLIDFVKIKKLLDKNNLAYIEKYVYIGAKKFETRMIIERVPEKFVKIRLKSRKKVKKNGKQLSKDDKARICLNIFIASVKLPLNSSFNFSIKSTEISS